MCGSHSALVRYLAILPQCLGLLEGLLPSPLPPEAVNFIKEAKVVHQRMVNGSSLRPSVEAKV